MANIIDNSIAYPVGTNAAAQISINLLGNSRVILSYGESDGGTKGKVKIGTVESDGSISFNSPTIFHNDNTAHSCSCVLNDSTIIVAFLNEDYTAGIAMVGSISGDTITFGAEYQFLPRRTNYINLVRLTDTKFMIIYQDDGQGDDGLCIIGNVSGNTISYGTAVRFCTEPVNGLMSSVIDNNHVFISYQKSINSTSHVYSVIAEINGDIITYGAETEVAVELASFPGSVKLDDTHVIVMYPKSDYSLASRIGTIDVNTNSVTYGTEQTRADTRTNRFFAPVASDSYTVTAGINLFKDSVWKTYIEVLNIDSSYSTITFEAPYQITNDSNQISTLRLANDQVLVVYADADDGYSLKAMTAEVAGTIADTVALLSSTYDLSHVKGNLRGKAAQGFVRPTLKQFYTSNNYEEILAGVTQDNFDSLNTQLWKTFQTNPSSVMTVDGQLRLTCIDNDNSQIGLTSNGTISGDFDFQIDFDASDFTYGLNGQALYLSLSNIDPYQGANQNIFLDATAQDSFLCGFVEHQQTPFNKIYHNEMSGAPAVLTGTAFQVGKLRLVRTGITLQFYYWESGWQLEATKMYLGDVDLYLSIFKGIWGSFPAQEGRFDNLLFNTGKLGY